MKIAWRRSSYSGGVNNDLCVECHSAPEASRFRILRQLEELS